LRTGVHGQMTGASGKIVATKIRPPRQRCLNSAVGLWSLKIKSNQWRLSGAPASSRAGVAMSLPARTRAHRWLHLFLKDINPRLNSGAAMRPKKNAKIAIKAQHL